MLELSFPAISERNVNAIRGSIETMFLQLKFDSFRQFEQ